MLEQLLGLPLFLDITIATFLIWWRVSASHSRSYGISTLDQESSLRMGRTEIHVHLHLPPETASAAQQPKWGHTRSGGGGERVLYDRRQDVG